MDWPNGLPFGATGCTAVKRPRQNRCTPFGAIEATHHRGTLMGNRGDLHAPDGSLGRQWRSRRWISCLLDTGDGWKAPMDKPGHNYPLFFHDEAVALAAGHRPCGECRPEALATFIAAWKIGHGMIANAWVPLKEIDQQLHNARLAQMSERRRVDAATLPDGAFVWSPTIDVRAMLVQNGWLWPWAHGGYSRPIAEASSSEPCFALTSAPFVRVLRAGYPVGSSSTGHSRRDWINLNR